MPTGPIYDPAAQQSDDACARCDSLPPIPDAAAIAEIVAQLQSQPLHDQHLVDLRASGLSDETIREAGLCSADAPTTQALGFHNSPALVIPYPGHPGYVRIKPDEPRIDNKGRPVKYESPRGGTNHLYFPVATRLRALRMGVTGGRIIITEGEKKALAADQEGFSTMAVPGVWGWCSAGAIHELVQINWRDREAVIVFDSDVVRKVDVKEATSALVEYLQTLGATVRVARLPDRDGHHKIGLDDYLVAHGRGALQPLVDNCKAWFDVLLDMIEPGLQPDALEVAVAPIYRRIQKAGVLAQNEMVQQLRRRLGDLHYALPPVSDLKRAVRQAPAYQPEWSSNRRKSEPAESEADDCPRFLLEGPGGNYGSAPERQGLYERNGDELKQLSNFAVVIEQEVQIEDDLTPHKQFVGHIMLHGEEKPFTINATDFPNNMKLQAAIYEAAGAKVELHCAPETLRTAISAVSMPETRRATVNFGWNEARDAYLVAAGKITAAGFQAAGTGSELRVDLTGAEHARRLDLHPLTPRQLEQTKRHVVDDLLPLCPERHIGFSLLGAVALAVLYPFVVGYNRPALWLVGLSGAGKSFFAKLFQNFFGNFPLNENATISWLSTPRRIQLEGYYFRDVFYLVDDYKPEHCPPKDATWVLQAYADAAARGRLRRDATAAESREIRGQLVCTGEDVPDHSASASAHDQDHLPLGPEGSRTRPPLPGNAPVLSRGDGGPHPPLAGK